MAQKSKVTSGRRKIGERAIRKRAEEIYLRRIQEGSPGDAETDWLEAEEELKNQ